MKHGHVSSAQRLHVAGGYPAAQHGCRTPANLWRIYGKVLSQTVPSTLLTTHSTRELPELSPQSPAQTPTLQWVFNNYLLKKMIQKPPTPSLNHSLTHAHTPDTQNPHDPNTGSADQQDTHPAPPSPWEGGSLVEI